MPVHNASLEDRQGARQSPFRFRERTGGYAVRLLEATPHCLPVPYYNMESDTDAFDDLMAATQSAESTDCSLTQQQGAAESAWMGGADDDGWEQPPVSAAPHPRHVALQADQAPLLAMEPYFALQQTGDCRVRPAARGAIRDRTPQLAQTSTGAARIRRPRVWVSEHLKDASYFAYRNPNNVRARARRQRRRDQQLHLQGVPKAAGSPAATRKRLLACLGGLWRSRYCLPSLLLGNSRSRQALQAVVAADWQ